MIKFLTAAAMSLWAVSVMAEIVVKSCDATIVAKENHGSMIIECGVGEAARISIGHDIDGGVFSLDNALLAVYGVPKKVDGNYPQVT